MNPEEAYEDLCTWSKRSAYLSSSIAVLDWDQRTHIPRRGHAHRAEQRATLTRIHHGMVTDPKIGELLATVEGTDLVGDPLSIEAVNMREWRRSYDRAVRIPEDLAVELARAAAEAQAAWEQARPLNNWDLFQPYLERMVALKLQQAHALGFENEPYDALLEYYEQGETAQELEKTFRELQPSLVDLLGRIRDSGRSADDSILRRHFPVAEQRGFALEVAQCLGYDLDAGRLDVSAHPFTTGIGPGDVRITTRYAEASFSEAFFSVIHEAGHAMYHQGLPAGQWGTPFCRPISLGVNESQSRLWENIVARSEMFWRFFFPRAQARFTALRDVSLADFVAAINVVRPGLIRTDADEVTYNLHVFLRFDLEVMLLRGDLRVNDLPEAWNAKMQDYLGLTPPDYASGVLQDVHWPSGSFGYFPTYTLGNMYAAQFSAAACDAVPDLTESIARGDFAPLLTWLRSNIHARGSQLLPRDLVKLVTGEDRNPHKLVAYLEQKYAPLG
jgi:carboxypeptidase Taq